MRIARSCRPASSTCARRSETQSAVRLRVHTFIEVHAELERHFQRMVDDAHAQAYRETG